MKFSTWLLTLWVALRPNTQETGSARLTVTETNSYHKGMAIVCTILSIIGIAGLLLIQSDGWIASFAFFFSGILAVIFTIPAFYHFFKTIFK